MQVLFVHPNYPAQFGHIASRLVRDRGVECVALSRNPPGLREGVRCLLADFFDVDGLAQQALQVLRKGSIPRQEKPRANTGCPTLPVGMA